MRTAVILAGSAILGGCGSGVIADTQNARSVSAMLQSVEDGDECRAYLNENAEYIDLDAMMSAASDFCGRPRYQSCELSSVTEGEDGVIAAWQCADRDPDDQPQLRFRFENGKVSRIENLNWPEGGCC